MENVPCEVFMNETKTEITLIQEKYPNLQTQESVVLEDATKIIKLQLEKLNIKGRNEHATIECIMLGFSCMNDNKINK
jgi:hypothetical protein